jgi:aspartate/methionine/tyrosine aminotransferase
MSVPKEFLVQQCGIWMERRNYIYNGLKNMGFELWKPEGAFYVLPKIKNSAQVVNDLYKLHNVIVYDGEWFGAPGRIRLSYALELPKIAEGLERIKEYLRDKQDWL